MNAQLYAAAFQAIYIDGLSVTFAASNLYVALLQPTYAFDRSHRRMADVKDYELTVEYYARQAVGNARIVPDASSNRLYLDADDVEFGGLGPGERIGAAVLLLGSGDDAPLRAYFALDRQGTTGGPVQVNWTDGHALRFREPA